MENTLTEATDKSVDPELLPLLEGFPDITLNAETLPGFRAAVAEMSVLPDPADHPKVTIKTVTVPGPQDAPDVRCLLFLPANGTPCGALLHIHGGGFVMGVPEMDAARNIAVVEAAGCALLSVDYRLSPEAPHPAALEDCHAALVWLAGQSGTLGFDAAKIAVIGESAGGGLAGGVALLARDRGSVPLACQLLIYPMMAPPGHEVPAATRDQRIGRYIWPAASNIFAWEVFFSGNEPDPATISGLAENLTGLPPTFIAVGELDLFVHDNLALTSRLMEAGTSVDAHVYPGAFHGFDRMTDAAVSKRFTGDMLNFIKRHLS